MSNKLYLWLFASFSVNQNKIGTSTKAGYAAELVACNWAGAVTKELSGKRPK